MAHALLCSLFLLAAPASRAHPGALSGGSASCGVEYSTPGTSFVIPDVGEAWYFRRISTCPEPFLWIKFNVTTQGQQLYVATNTPMIKRFADKLFSNMVLFGPGLPALDKSLVPDDVMSVAPYSTGLLLKSPELLDSCGFVDENGVMGQYDSVVEGRCSEVMDFKKYDKNPLIAWQTWRLWWLYSKNLNAAQVGTYYLASWLTDRSTGQLAVGKYEITLGPWSWSGYASPAAQTQARSQGSTCTCATNALAYSESSIKRLGNMSSDDRFQYELSPATCGSKKVACDSSTVCHSPPKVPLLSKNSSAEWSGRFRLLKVGRYRWVFQAFSRPYNYTYPDASMDLFVTLAAKISSAEKAADTHLRVDTSDLSGLRLQHGSQLNLSLNTKQTLFFSGITTELTIDIGEASSLVIFTQHQPAEFMANVLLDPDGLHLSPEEQQFYDSGVSTRTAVGSNRTCYENRAGVVNSASKYGPSLSSGARLHVILHASTIAGIMALLISTS